MIRKNNMKEGLNSKRFKILSRIAAILHNKFYLYIQSTTLSNTKKICSLKYTWKARSKFNFGNLVFWLHCIVASFNSLFNYHFEVSALYFSVSGQPALEEAEHQH